MNKDGVNLRMWIFVYRCTNKGGLKEIDVFATNDNQTVTEHTILLRIKKAH